MNRLLLASLCTLALAATAHATEQTKIPATAGYKEVNSISALTPLYSYNVLSDDSLIIWRDPFHPYLVKLTFPVPAHDLQFSHVIGVTATTGRIYARFDAVQVRGMRYSIRKIYQLTPNQAYKLTRAS